MPDSQLFINEDALPPEFYKKEYPEKNVISKIAFSDMISTQTREWLHACWTDVEKVKKMIKDGIDVHTTNAHGFSGLHFAAWKFNLNVAQVLVSAGHDVNFEDCNGETPLDACIDNFIDEEKKAYTEMVDFLESVGAYRHVEQTWIKAHNQVKYAPYQ